MTDKMIEVTGMKKYFQVKQFFKKSNFVHAVDNVDFFIEKGQTLGIAGESGCGKTTLARCTLQLVKPDAGSIKFDGKLMGSKRSDLKEFRQRTALVFQDPSSSLDPRMTIADVVGEPFSINHTAHGEEREGRILELLKSVGLELDHMYRYPHEFSGGQKQRIAIARALAVNPDLVLLDEPTSALDVSVQAQVLNLLESLQKSMGLTYMLISHDLNTVRHISHRIAIMYLGKIVESGSDTAVFESAMHPYTQALLSANPLPDPTAKKKRIILKGDVPSPMHPPPGCRFHTRCQYRMPICDKEEPKFLEVEKEHFVACHLFD